MIRRHRRGIIAILLFSLVMINYMDRVALSVAAKPISAEFGLSPVMMGYLFSSFLWTYVPSLIPLGILLDRTGSKLMAGAGVALWSLATAAGGATTGFASLFATRLVMGASEATTFPTIGRVVREWAPQRERGLFTTIANCGSSAGPAVGALLTGSLVAALGWRMALVLLGLVGILWLVAWYLVYDQPERARWLDEDERRMILAQRNGTPTDAAAPQASSIRHLVGQGSTLGVMVTQACLVYTTYLFASWLPSFLQSRFDLGVGSTGLYTAVPYLLTVVLQLTVARISDVVIPARLIPSGARRYFIAVMILVALSILAAPFATALWQVMIIVTLVLTGSTSASSLNFTLASDLLRNPRDAGRITSMVAFGGNSFGLISPIVTGYIVAGTGAYSWAFWVAGALLCLGAGCTLLCTRRPIAAEHGPPMVSTTGA